MELKLERKYLKSDYTIGILSVDGQYFCEVLEDKVRDCNKDGDLLDAGETKVYGKTAIPYGRYQIAMNIVSPKFSNKPFDQMVCQGKLPRLMNVPHFEGVLIHCGNYAKDSYGCLIVGENKAKGSVIHSQHTFRKLYAKMNEAYKRGEQIWITIE
jgi:hypothetical protein